MFSDAFLREIPKTDLHVHLDGSMRLGTLIELAREHGVELPSYDEDELRRTVFKADYPNLEVRHSALRHFFAKPLSRHRNI